MVFATGRTARAWLTRPIAAPRMGHIGQKYATPVAAQTVSTTAAIARKAAK
jgi:hypothetical protein